jgi:hypothetical protein
MNIQAEQAMKENVINFNYNEYTRSLVGNDWSVVYEVCKIKTMMERNYETYLMVILEGLSS